MSKVKKTVVPVAVKTTPLQINATKKVKHAPVKKVVEADAVIKVAKKSEKKILKEEISLSLIKTFTNIKKAVGEKKFNKHVKKATKVLVSGVIKKTKKLPAQKIPVTGK